MRTTSIVILSYNTYDFTKLCIQSIRQYTAPGTYELIVVDNASVDGSVQWLQEQSDIRCIFNTQNMGFPKGCNQGMELAAGDAILLLNSDTVVTPRWLEQLMAALYSDATIGAVGCVTNACSNGQQIEVPYQKIRDMFAFAERYNHTDSRQWKLSMTLVGFCFLFRREVYEEIGGMDEQFSPGNCEDDDYSLRIWKAGYQMLLCRDTFIHHFGSASFQQGKNKEEQAWRKSNQADLIARNVGLLKKKWALSCGYKLCNPAIEELPEVLPAGMKILLMDCGTGIDLFRLAEKYPTAKLQGICRHKTEVWLPRQAGFLVECLEEKECLEDCLEDHYDYIFLHNFLDEKKDQSPIIKILKKHLRHRGMLYFWQDGKLGKFSAESVQRSEIVSLSRNRVLDDHKICFITCVNNEEQYAQCVKQLQSLHIPDGMQIESLAVRGAQYMTEGYQEAMLQSDAKYKIYLHQDVWILQENFLEVLVRAFRSHPEYGIAGVVGSADLPANAIWWESSHLLGTIYDDHTTRMGLYRYQLSDVGQKAAALDGLLLATQYDIDWRTDVFQKWHFYDLSQCMEFRKKGYQPFVLPQRLPFCMHFCGQNAMRGYDEERIKFIQIYERR